MPAHVRLDCHSPGYDAADVFGPDGYNFELVHKG